MGAWVTGAAAAVRSRGGNSGHAALCLGAVRADTALTVVETLAALYHKRFDSLQLARICVLFSCLCTCCVCVVCAWVCVCAWVRVYAREYLRMCGCMHIVISCFYTCFFLQICPGGIEEAHVELPASIDAEVASIGAGVNCFNRVMCVLACVDSTRIDLFGCTDGYYVYMNYIMIMYDIHLCTCELYTYTYTHGCACVRVCACVCVCVHVCVRVRVHTYVCLREYIYI